MKQSVSISVALVVLLVLTNISFSTTAEDWAERRLVFSLKL